MKTLQEVLEDMLDTRDHMDDPMYDKYDEFEEGKTTFGAKVVRVGVICTRTGQRFKVLIQEIT